MLGCPAFGVYLIRRSMLVIIKSEIFRDDNDFLFETRSVQSTFFRVGQEFDDAVNDLLSFAGRNSDNVISRALTLKRRVTIHIAVCLRLTVTAT